MASEPVLPTFTFPKVRLVGFAPSRKVAATPVPLSGIARGEPGASLVIEAVPLALPAVVGENVALKEVFCPGLRVSGAVMPLMVNPVPEALAAEMVTLAVPEFVKVTVCDPLLP